MPLEPLSRFLFTGLSSSKTTVIQVDMQEPKKPLSSEVKLGDIFPNSSLLLEKDWIHRNFT